MGETFADAAQRELFEETGLWVATVGASIARKEFVVPLPEGDQVVAEEHYFLVRVSAPVLSRAHWTSGERAVMSDYGWWSVQDLRSTQAQVFPTDLVAMLTRLGVQGKASQVVCSGRGSASRPAVPLGSPPCAERAACVAAGSRAVARAGGARWERHQRQRGSCVR